MLDSWLSRGALFRPAFMAIGISLLPLPLSPAVKAQAKRHTRKKQKPSKKIPLRELEKALPGAVSLGLDWLARHQDIDGKWDSKGFMSNCKGEKCTGPGGPGYNVGVTGLALLAFLDGGKDAAGGKYKKVVKEAALWLTINQNGKGFIGPKNGAVPMYNHSISTLALCRAFALQPDLPLKDHIRKALDFISSARDPLAAWRYYPRHGNDSSVTGWVTITLCTARRLGWKTKREDFEGALAWFRAMTDPKTGRVGYTEPGTPPPRAEEMVDKFPAERSESLTALALEARLSMGIKPKKNSPLDKGIKLLLARKPAWEEGSVDMYFWYFGTRALFRLGGAPWKDWRKAALEAVLPHQRITGCARGSWDPVGPWGKEGGRIYSTALMVSVLEACLSKNGAKGGFRRIRPFDLRLRPEYLAKILSDLPPREAADQVKAWMPKEEKLVVEILKVMKPEKAVGIFDRLPFKMLRRLKKKMK